MSLAEHINRLRAEPELRTPLTHFLAGASWCSCAPDRDIRRALPAAKLHARAIANAKKYVVLGTLEHATASFQLVHQLLGTGRSVVRTRAAANAPHANAFVQCVDPSTLPAEDRPNAAQKNEVTKLLSRDVALYQILRTTWEHKLARIRRRSSGDNR